MNISVLGCGRWGSFIAWYLCRNKFNVTIWGREGSKNIARFKEERKNDYLQLDKAVKISTDLKSAVEKAEIIVISIAAQALRSLAKNIALCGIDKSVPIVLCMKGLECESGKRLSQVISEELPNPVAIWGGPGHVQDFVAGIPNCMVIDSEDLKLKTELSNIFSSDLIRFYIGTDLIGNEIGAAAKNVMGIAAGMLDALGYTSLKGALMARGAREIARLINAMGGNMLSAYGLCHLGDYQATLFSPYSNNRLFGELFVKGESFCKLAEGFYTVKALNILAKEHVVEMPICDMVDKILTRELEPKKAFTALFMRRIKEEF